MQDDNPTKNNYIEEDQVREVIVKDFPDLNIKEVVDIVIGFKVVSFSNTEDWVIVGNDLGHLRFNRTDKSVDEAVDLYKAGQRD